MLKVYLTSIKKRAFSRRHKTLSQLQNVYLVLEKQLHYCLVLYPSSAVQSSTINRLVRLNQPRRILFSASSSATALSFPASAHWCYRSSASPSFSWPWQRIMPSTASRQYMCGRCHLLWRALSIHSINESTYRTLYIYHPGLSSTLLPCLDHTIVWTNPSFTFTLPLPSSDLPAESSAELLMSCFSDLRPIHLPATQP